VELSIPKAKAPTEIPVVCGIEQHTSTILPMSTEAEIVYIPQTVGSIIKKSKE